MLANDCYAISGTVSRDGIAIIQIEAQKHKKYQCEVLKKLEVNSFLCIPMKIHKRVLGTIALADTKHRDDFIEIKDTFQVIANFIALEIEHQQTQITLVLHSEIARNIAEGVYLIRASDGVIAFANPKFEEMFGYEPGELVGKHVSVVNAPSEKSQEETAKEIIKSLKKNGVWEGEIKNIKKDGALFWSHATVSTFKHKEYGTAWVSIHKDITDHKRSEMALQESREQLQAIIDNTTSVIYLKDIKGKYILINSRYEDLFHTTREEITGKTDFDIFPKDMAEAFQRNDRIVLEKGVSIEFEEYAPHDDGTHSYISIKFPLHDSLGKIYGVCGISTDITERKKAEIALKQFSKKLVENQELERKRIASELHDSLAQNMIVISNEIQKIISNSPIKKEARESLKMASSLALQTIDDLEPVHQLPSLTNS